MTQTEIDFTVPPNGACIEGAASRLAFVFGGKATFTLRSLRSGKHYTYRVCATERGDGHFVKVLAGPDDGYRYLGACFERGPLRITRTSAFDDGAPCVRAFRWFQRHPDSPDCEIWHSGTCSRCGRELTDPESIATGLGPVCRTRQLE